MSYADIIVDISLQKLDKTFSYHVPEELSGELAVGMKVSVPFGSRTMTGYVLGISETTDADISKVRDIIAIEQKAVPVESELIALAAYLKKQYGCTMNQALKTVLPAKRKVAKRAVRVAQLPEFERITDNIVLNEKQQAAVDGILSDYPKPALIYGVTGSGKTEVYMRLIDEMIKRGKQTILLIPEISLTYQNMKRFYGRYGDRVGIVNSRLSAGEKYDVFEKAMRGEIDVMIGPRSALFTPFRNLGMIIADEEHETAYFCETAPRYKTVEVAMERGRISGAAVVLGSATPSVDDYDKATRGEYGLYLLPERAVPGSALPEVEIVDMREELRAGNKSILSRSLVTGIQERLARGEQTMLFLNRRGYANYVWCLSCGEPIKCPHCDVSLPSHLGHKLMCHYCGYEAEQPDICPSCGSPYLAHRGAGTEKVESIIKRTFPEARVLRMDADTTTGKAGHSDILSAFAAGKADILVGTQMIVKGHDFPKVTLVGIIAAELSLNTSDFRASERTFQLLVQAAGRAGRADSEGKVIVQTYVPENSTIRAAATQDYQSFFEEEMQYRKLLAYPPCGSMLAVLMTHADTGMVHYEAAQLVANISDKYSSCGIEIIGPSDAGIRKIQDKYRCAFYAKHSDEEILRRIRDEINDSKIESTLQMDLL